MGGIWMKRLLTAMVAVALAAVLAGQVGAQRQVPYSDPAWAPQWFKDCQGYKVWVEWTRDTRNPNNPDHQLLWAVNDPFSWPPNPNVGPTSLSIVIPNARVPQNYKQIWFQVELTEIQAGFHWQGPLLEWGDDYDYSKNPPEPRDPIDGLTLPWVPGNPGPGTLGWHDDTQADPFTVEAYWEIRQQPQWERLTLNVQNYRVDKLRLVTQCNPIPEPVFFQMGALLGLSGLGMLKLRRR
jgi:hypothetical protein